jgi:CubicO group peptidase (beta-lactamase class C family)
LPDVSWRRLARVGIGAALCAATFGAPAAHAAKECAEPGSEWQRATPAEAGMDAAKLQGALDYGSTQASFAVRVYRHGCLVGEDRFAPVNRTQRYESYSMAKSVTSLLFGRAMTLGLISPADPVGALVPEADGPHGTISMLDLLTMTSGLEWNGFRDYNIFTMQDRVRDALTLRIAHPAGRYYEYAQSAVALLAEATARAVGEDPVAFFQRELLDDLGIPADAWEWKRDPAGHILGFMGVNMRPDDFGRLGDLLRRGGVWRGRRVLSEEYVREAVAPSRTNGCYAWLIWVNAGKPCIGVTIQDRPVSDTRDMPDMPADMYSFAGLFGQLVTVFPSQGIVVQRSGQDSSLVFAGGTDWETELYTRVLGSLTDGTKVEVPGDAPATPRAAPTIVDYGFQTALLHPESYSQGAVQQPLPPPGPARARAAVLTLARSRASSKGDVAVRLTCPPRAGTGRCSGRARLDGARGRFDYDLANGQARVLHFTLTARRIKLLRAAGTLDLGAVALNRAAGGSTVARATFNVRH